jgi:hypothetical protein
MYRPNRSSVVLGLLVAIVQSRIGRVVTPDDTIDPGLDASRATGQFGEPGDP